MKTNTNFFDSDTGQTTISVRSGRFASYAAPEESGHILFMSGSMV